MFLALVLSAAHADDSPWFFGGGLALRPRYTAETFTLGGEAEADLRGSAGPLNFRLDLDLTATLVPDLGIEPVTPDVPVLNMVRPEWAMIEATGESWAARGGVVNAAFGLEDWDDSALYLPTHGQYFEASPGRMLGSEFGWSLWAGPTFTVGGGYDLDYEEAIVEANINYESDGWATWSGLAVYPALEAYMAVLGAEVYPAEVFTLALGGMAGSGEGNVFANASIYGVILPSAMVNPTIRVEGSYDPGGWTGSAPWAVGVGGAVSPTDWAKLLIETKMMGTDGAPVSGVYASLCVFRPEPSEAAE